MKLFQILLYGFLFYLAFKAIKYVIQMVAGPKENKRGNSTFTKKNEKSKFDINREDIIEADFEEIKESDKENQTKD